VAAEQPSIEATALGGVPDMVRRMTSASRSPSPTTAAAHRGEPTALACVRASGWWYELWQWIANPPGSQAQAPRSTDPGGAIMPASAALQAPSAVSARQRTISVRLGPGQVDRGFRVRPSTRKKRPHSVEKLAGLLTRKTRSSRSDRGCTLNTCLVRAHVVGEQRFLV
jgi:hypothetical protein